jgi:hypothetical protein
MGARRRTVATNHKRVMMLVQVTTAAVETMQAPSLMKM